MVSMGLRASIVMKLSTQPDSCSNSSVVSGNTISGREGRSSSWLYLSNNTGYITAYYMGRGVLAYDQ